MSRSKNADLMTAIASTTIVVRTFVDAVVCNVTTPFTGLDSTRSCRLNTAQVSPWEAALHARHTTPACPASPAMY